MTNYLLREEREMINAQLAETERQISELTENLAGFSGPILYGQSKNHMKGLLEQQLANLERQRDVFRKRLGYD